MATELPPARPVASVAPITPWDRQRDDPRQAILARLLSPDGRPLPVAATDATPTAGGLVRARLIEARSGNEAMVDIGGKSFLIRTRLPLPVGASVLLRIIDPGVDDAEVPRVDGRPAALVDSKGKSLAASRVGVETLVDDAAGSDDVDAISPRRQTTTAPALETLRSDTGDARVRVSGSARLLSELASTPNSQPKMIQVAPLGEAEQADPSRAAQHLQNAVDKSGLFYESHVQAWSEGRRGLESLRAEPQGGLPQHSARVLDADEQSALPEPRALNAALASIPASVRPLVQEQISLLETGQLGLQGTWQGQPFTVRIEPDEQNDNQRQLPGEQLSNWKVRIDMETPNLGRLQLDIGLIGTAASVKVRAENAQGARTTLGAQTADLLQALDARGVRMQELAIDKTPLAARADEVAPTTTVQEDE